MEPSGSSNLLPHTFDTLMMGYFCMLVMSLPCLKICQFFNFLYFYQNKVQLLTSEFKTLSLSFFLSPVFVFYVDLVKLFAIPDEHLVSSPPYIGALQAGRSLLPSSGS